MKEIAWVTDIHLDYLDPSGVDRFYAEISGTEPDLLLVGGDTGEADSVFGFLQQIAEILDKPVYFVLGNHDYYHSSIMAVRNQARLVARCVRNLTWLDESGVIELTRSTALVGHGAWGDARLGNCYGTTVMLNDFDKIEDLRGLDRKTRLAQLNRLGDEAAEYLHRVLNTAFNQFSDVIVLTHVPPFEEVCLYQGTIGDPDWLPFFTCGAVGAVLKKLMERNREKRIRVFCGHSHHAATEQILPNLTVRVGAADYGLPTIQTLFRVE